jgi:hypothetical protein
MTRTKGIFTAMATIASVLTLSAGLAFADNLHLITGTTGQTGSNVFSSCPNSGFDVVGKTSAAPGSPFNPDATKIYAGNTGNPATNPKAVSQYDNACSQAALHQLP